MSCTVFWKRKVILFKNEKEKVNDTIASAATFTFNTSRSNNLFPEEVIIDNPLKVKSIFDDVLFSENGRSKNFKKNA